MSVVDDIREGRAQVEWADVVSRGNDGVVLRIRVMRDSLKVGGVRMAASARELQQIADLLGCLLLTPKVVDLVYLQAQLRFDPVLRADGDIAANSTAARISALIDAEIEKLGGDPGGLIDSIGKYWVLHNHLATPVGLPYGKETACNYGWISSSAQSAALTPGLKCWQTPGFRHNDQYADPSQLVRLMQRQAFLTRPDQPEEPVDLLLLLQDPKLAHLANHDGVLKYLRIVTVPENAPDVSPSVSTYQRG